MRSKKAMIEAENPVVEDGAMDRNITGVDEMAGTADETTVQPQDYGSWEEDNCPEVGEDDFETGNQFGNEELPIEYGYAAEDGSLPELTEEEMFGEGQSDEIPKCSDGENAEKISGDVETAYSGDAPLPVKLKRASRKKKAETSGESAAFVESVEKEDTDADMQEESSGAEQEAETSVMGEELNPEAGMQEDGQLLEGISDDMDSDSELLLDSADFKASSEAAVGKADDIPDGEGGTIIYKERSETPTAKSAPRPVSRARKAEAPVLTLEARGEVETEESRDDAIWHEIHNAYRTRRILTGQLGGIEQTDSGKTIAIVDYKGFRIVIPLKEMMINVGRSPSGQEYAELMLRQNKILGNMLGAEIDFSVKGIDSRSRSVVASRREAMLKKRQIFYLDTDAEGMYRVYEGRIVQARVIAVAEKVIRVEIFGVECSIMARDLAWDWIGDAHERFSVGDQVLVRILSVRRDSLEDMGVKADVKSVTQDTQQENLKKCRVQSKYAGKVTDVHKGVVYIRLSNGANAVAHACYDYRTPGKKDDVSFAVTKIDEERGVAVGIITRIIRQNL